MKVSIILGHPQKGSFNHAIAQRSKQTLLENAYEVFYNDLYHDNFNPVILHEEIPEDGIVDPVIRKHCHEISESDGIIIIHPNWWGQPPAILKGWVDRVMRPGVAYRFEEGDKGEGIPIGLLKAKAALVFNTSNTFEERELIDTSTTPMLIFLSNQLSRCCTGKEPSNLLSLALSSVIPTFYPVPTGVSGYCVGGFPR